MRQVAKKAPPKPAAKKVIKKKVAPKPKPKKIIKKKVAKPAPKPKPKPAPKKRIVRKAAGRGPARNTGTAIVGASGAANPGGAGFAAFFLVLPWVAIFARAYG